MLLDCILKGNYSDIYLNNSSQDILGFCLAIPKELLTAPLVYAWFLFITVGMIGLKSRSAGYAGFIAFIIGTVFVSALPQNTHALALVLMAIAITVILYRVFTKES